MPPKQKSRIGIDTKLRQASWIIQYMKELNIMIKNSANI